jgi:hypothetical protein
MLAVAFAEARRAHRPGALILGQPSQRDRPSRLLWRHESASDEVDGNRGSLREVQSAAATIKNMRVDSKKILD